MTGYLQRLYDRAGTPGPAAPAIGAQRSQSPLVTVDQRLGMADYGANFALGVPGEIGETPGDGEPEAAPSAARETPADRPRRASVTPPRADQVTPPRAEPPPIALDRPADPPAPRAAETTADRPAMPVSPLVPPAMLETLIERAPPSEPARDPAPRLSPSPTTPQPVEPPAPRITPAAPDDPADWAPLSPPDAQPFPVDPLPPPVLPLPVQATETITFRDSPTSTTEALLPPVPPALEPLPPDPAAIDWTRVEARIAEMVLRQATRPEAVAPPAPAPTAPQSTAPAATAPARPRTAAAASIIGKIERPARHATLFGTRLR